MIPFYIHILSKVKILQYQVLVKMYIVTGEKKKHFLANLFEENNIFTINWFKYRVSLRNENTNYYLFWTLRIAGEGDSICFKKWMLKWNDHFFLCRKIHPVAEAPWPGYIDTAKMAWPLPTSWRELFDRGSLKVSVTMMPI